MAALLQIRRGTSFGILEPSEPFFLTPAYTLNIGTDGIGGYITLVNLNVTNAGNIVLSGNVTAIDGTFTGNVDITGNLYIGGDITLGNNDTDIIRVESPFSGSLIPSITSVYDLGSDTKRWNTLYVDNIDASVITGSITINYPDITNIPIGIVSGSSQVDHNLTLNYESRRHIDHNAVSMSAGLGLSGGGTLMVSRIFNLDTGSSHFIDAVNNLNNLVIPSGTVSGSSQITDVTDPLYEEIASGTHTLVSGSVQINYPEISNIPTGLVSGSSQLTSSLDIRYELSGSSQPLPSGLVSGSSQIDVTQTTNYNLINQYTDVDNLDYMNSIGVLSGSAIATDITSLNNFTSSIQNEVDSLTAQTGSYVPYTGATGGVNLGDNTLDTTGRVNNIYIGAINDSGSNSIIIGNISSSNTDNELVSIGSGSSPNNTHTRATFVGSYSNQNSASIHFEVEDVSLQQSFDYLDLELSGAGTITVTSTAGFEASQYYEPAITGSAVRLYLTVNSGIPPQWSYGSLANDWYTFEIINSTTLQLLDNNNNYVNADFTANGNSPDMTLGPQVVGPFENVMGLGYGAEVTKNNQIVLGDANVVEVAMGNGDIIYPLSAAMSGAFEEIASGTHTLVSGSVQIILNDTIGNISASRIDGIVSSSVDWNMITNKPTVVSGSSQINYPEISNIPNGIISSSDQVTSSLDLLYEEIASGTHTLVSGSSQLTGSYDLRYTLSGSIPPLPSGVVSGSDQLSGSFEEIASGTHTLVSGSIQINYPEISNIPDGIISGSSQLDGTTINNLTGSFTGSFVGDGSGLTGLGALTLPPGVISGSSQLDGTTINSLTGSFYGDGSGLTGVISITPLQSVLNAGNTATSSNGNDIIDLILEPSASYARFYFESDLNTTGLYTFNPEQFAVTLTNNTFSASLQSKIDISPINGLQFQYQSGSNVTVFDISSVGSGSSTVHLNIPAYPTESNFVVPLSVQNVLADEQANISLDSASFDNLTLTNVSATGSFTGIFYGDGSGLTGISGSGGGTATFDQTVNQVSHGFSVPDAIRHNGTIWVHSIANTPDNAGTLGIVSSVEDADNFTYTYGGLLTTGSWTNGTSYFLSTDTSGSIVVEPSYAVGEVREYIGTGTPEGLLIEIDIGDEITESAITTLPSGLVSGSSQINYPEISNIPAGIISSSDQLSGSFEEIASGTHTLVSGSSQLTGSYDLRYELQGTGIISGSDQVTSSLDLLYEEIASGTHTLVSGSSQLTGSYDLRYILSGSVQPLPSGVVSGSSQLTSSYDLIYELQGRGIISGSDQLSGSFEEIASGTHTLVSGSIQVIDILTSLNLYTSSNDIVINGLNIFTSSIQNEVDGLSAQTSSYLTTLPDGLVSGSDQVTSSLDLLYEEIASGTHTLVSGSSQLTGSYDLRYTLSGSVQPLPDGLVSGSDQVSGSFVQSNLLGEPSGSDKVVNMVSLTQAEYDAGSPVPTTFYVITDAPTPSYISGSSQLDGTIINNLTLTNVSASGSFSGSFIGDGSGLTNLTLPNGLVSGSDQVTSSLDLLYEEIASGTHTLVSGSSQLDGTTINNLTLTNVSATGSFSGSFYGDGSNLTGVTSYTDTDTLNFINSIGVVSGSIEYQQNLDVDPASEVVASVPTSSYDGVFFDYVIKNGSNARAGMVMATYIGETATFTDNSTLDIGDTNPVTMSVDISSGNIRLIATTSTTNWVIKTLIRKV